MALFHPRSLCIQPYLGYRSRERLFIQVRALRSPRPGFGPATPAQTLRTLLRQFASPEASDIAVTLEVTGADGERLVSCERVTDPEGYALFDLALDPPWDLPEHPVWETVQLRWINEDGPQCAEGHVLAPGRDGRLAVISDIDDTIIETGMTGGWRSLARNWRRVLAQLPGDRAAVPGADIFYGTLGGGQTLPEGEIRAAARIPATRRPFFYVSSSPWNLFSYLVAFMRAKNLPVGPLLLRDWGLNRDTFGSASHGAHKRAAIDTILGTYPGMRFVLIGDDTQGDLTAFAHVVEHYPARVAAVFVRVIAHEALSPAEQAARAAIEAAGVPLWLGEGYAAGAEFLNRLGFTPGGETEQIVHTIEEAKTADPTG